MKGDPSIRNNHAYQGLILKIQDLSSLKYHKEMKDT